MGVFDYISISRTALGAFRQGMNIAGYNVANANTEGYSRRVMQLGPTQTVEVRNGIIGTGVDVTGVKRQRDAFLDFATRRELGRMGTDKSREEILSALEPVLGGTDSAGLTTALTSFFDSFETLSVQPDSPSSRANVVAQADNLASTLNRVDAQFDEAQRNADSRVVATLDRVNAILVQVRQINLDITSQEAGGAEASDLRDQRDKLLDELSQKVPVRIVEANNGQTSVFLDSTGDPLLAGVSMRQLQAVKTADGFTHVSIDRGGEITDISGALGGGELGGYLEARDTDIASYRTQLDTLASVIANQFNTVQKAGFDHAGNAGVAMFVPDPPGAHAAAAIRINSAVEADPNLVAASSAAGEAGNNSNALAFVALRTRTLASLGDQTISGYAAGVIAGVGTDVKSVSAGLEASQTIVDSLDQQRSAISGVSLDEEAADLVRWQQAFQASARFLQMSNQMIDEVLNDLAR